MLPTKRRGRRGAADVFVRCQEIHGPPNDDRLIFDLVDRFDVSPACGAAGFAGSPMRRLLAAALQ